MGKKKQCQISFSWAPKSLWMVTAATKLEDACSLEEKLLQTLHSILKSRDITLLTKVCIVKAIVFPVVMYGCENWTIKKAGCWRIDFKLWCWRRLLRVPWTEKRSVNLKGNQLWIVTVRTDAEAEAPMLWSPGVKRDSLEKTLMLGKIEGRRRRWW